MPDRPTVVSDEASRLARPVRHLLKDRAYQELRSRILKGELPPGSFMSERQLSASMDMSKTPIRAALERLENEGLVRVSPQQGVVVREMTLREIADQFEIRMALETYIVRTLAGKLTLEQTERLTANLNAQQANILTCDQMLLVDLDVEFHALFCDFLGNEEISRVTGRLRDRVQHVIYLVTNHDDGRFSSIYEEHYGIAEAVMDGDANLAVERLTKHFEYGKRRLLSPRSI